MAADMSDIHIRPMAGPAYGAVWGNPRGVVCALCDVRVHQCQNEGLATLR